MSFYSNFLAMCNRIGKTPSKVVTEVGLKKSAVTRWKGGGNPTDATAQKIADYFGVPVSELTEEKEKAPTQEGERIPHSALREYLVGQGVRILLDTDAKVTEQTIVNTLRKLSELQEQNDK